MTNMPGCARSRQNSVCMIVYYTEDLSVTLSVTRRLKFKKCMTNIHALIFCHPKLLACFFAGLHECFHLRHILNSRIYDVVSRQPESIIAKDSWLSKRFVCCFHSLEMVHQCFALMGKLVILTFQDSSDAIIQSTLTLTTSPGFTAPFLSIS